MCGIVGSVGTVNNNFDIQTLDDVLGHRGPDAAHLEQVSVGGVASTFGHTRLAIVDLSEAGKQPMYSQDGRWLLVYNGELYNHQELRSEIGGVFQGHSDSETLVECLSRWGIKRALKRLNGIFAFAAYDLKENKVHIARDPFGVKPVYLHQTSTGLFFSSEIRALKEISGLRFKVNEHALQTFLAMRFTPSPETLWAGVQRLRPGALATYNCITHELKEGLYIEPSNQTFQGSRAEAVETYQKLLQGAVHRQLLSDVPLGVFLSGGVDSALIAALARESGNPISAFTVGFDGDHEECEIEPAAHTAHALGLSHDHVRIDADMAWAAVSPAIDHLEEPLGTTSILPMWYLAEMAGNKVKTVLTGQGSDEPWGGYRRYQGALIADYIPKSSGWNVLAQLASNLPNRFDFLERAFRSFSCTDEADRFMEIYALFTAQERSEFIKGAQYSDLSTPVRDWLDWFDHDQRKTSVERMMGIDCRMNLADDLLLYGDKITMAHSVEARVPILDLEVVQFIESLPRHHRMAWSQTKIVHKRMAEQYLPTEIVNRPKLGFQVPIDAWLRGPWRERAGQILLENEKFSSLLDRTMVERQWVLHQNNTRNLSRQLFSLIGLAYWAKKNL